MAAWPCTDAPPDSTEYRRVEYALHVALGRLDGRVRRISAIDNPLARHQFSRRTSGVLKLHSFVAEGEGCDARAEPGRLRWRAAAGANDGMRVHIGGVPPGVLEDASEPNDADGANRRRLVYCLAAVGMAWPVDAATLARCQTQPGVRPPAGYDSFVDGEPADRASAEAEEAAWRSDWIESPTQARDGRKPVSYWLTDRSQVLPLYVVDFELPPISFTPPEPAPVPAAAPKGDAPSCAPGQCQYHDCPCEYYCPRCQTSMCAECKLTGHHSHGPALGHALQPLCTAHRAAVANCQDGANPILLATVDRITTARDTLRSRGESVRQNATELRSSLAALVSAVSAQIDHAENCRLAALHSQEIELARQLKTLGAGEDLLRAQADELPMAEFMQTWATHVHSRAPMLSEGAPDLLVAGPVGGAGSEHGSGVIGFDAHGTHGTPQRAGGLDGSLGALSISGGSSLVSFDSPLGNAAAQATPMAAGSRTPASAASARSAAAEPALPLPRLELQGAVGLRLTPADGDAGEEPGLERRDATADASAPALWWEAPPTAADAMRTAGAARSGASAAASGAGGPGVQWGWSSERPRSAALKSRRLRSLRSAMRGAAMAGAAAARAGAAREGRVLSRSSAVVVGETLKLMSGEVEALQSVDVLSRHTEPGEVDTIVRVEIAHGAAAGGLGLSFGLYEFPYRFAAACTADASAVQITNVVPGSVASVRPDLRAGAVVAGVNGKSASSLRAEEILTMLAEAEAATAPRAKPNPRTPGGGAAAGPVLVLELVQPKAVVAAAALPPSPGEQRCADEPGEAADAEEQAPAPPPPFAKRVASQLSDVLDEVVEEEQTVRPEPNGANHRVVDWLTLCVVW